MKVLLLVTAFNGLSQRVYDDLISQQHEVAIIFAGNDAELRAAIDEHSPDMILCPFLKQRIPDDIWKSHLCIIIHPGIRGDRGPSSLDWAITRQVNQWGVTALEADAEMDAGDIWSSHDFSMRIGSKASLYRNEVTQAAMVCVRDMLNKISHGEFTPSKLNYDDPEIKGQLQPLMKQEQRTIDWEHDSTAVIITKINAADSFPGVRDTLYGQDVYLYNVHPEASLKGSAPKQILAQHQGALCISTRDGAIWVGHLKRAKSAGQAFFKLPAAWVLEEHLIDVPTLELPVYIDPRQETFHEIRYRRQDDIGYLYFDFHNGAMGTSQCQRLLKAYQAVAASDVKAIVLMGGKDFWSNGIHLNHIEYADSPEEESWQNINAINDVVKAIFDTQDKLIIAALNGNAGAGGVMMALACDKVVIRNGVILNPHYQTMALYGSEYWTYSLPKRVGPAMAKQLTQRCLPIGAERARAIGLVDHVLCETQAVFDEALHAYVSCLIDDDNFARALDFKITERFVEQQKLPLDEYRVKELAEMKVCFASERYHQARQYFVYKRCIKALPEHLKLLSDFKS